MHTTALFDSLTTDRTELADAFDKPAAAGMKDLLMTLTQGEAHFIYELLQNADDAGASEVYFDLHPSGLMVRHNAPKQTATLAAEQRGRKGAFTITDETQHIADREAGRLGHVNAITSIGSSTKRADETEKGVAPTIGRFGIGFKSVFRFTSTPHIYEDAFAFRIERFIVPHKLHDTQPAGVPTGQSIATQQADAPLRLTGWTMFWLPFNHPEASKGSNQPRGLVPASQAYAQVATRLNDLRRPLLFLRNLKEIHWAAWPTVGATRTAHTGVYRAESKQAITRANRSALILPIGVRLEVKTLHNETDGQTLAQRFLCVARPCAEQSGLEICLAFALREDGSLDPYQPGSAPEKRIPADYELFCYFNTRQHPGLNFILQAPWLVKSDRENIIEDAEWNKKLIEETATLLGDILPVLRNLPPQALTDVGANVGSLLTDELIALLPHEEWSGKIFSPLDEAVLEALKSEMVPLLPTSEGRHVTVENAYFAESDRLRKVLPQAQLRQLTGQPAAAWVFASIGGRLRDSDAFEFIESLLDSDRVINPSRLAAMLKESPAFIEQQSDEWLGRFYRYLSEGPKELIDNERGRLRQLPFLRLEDNSHVAPYAAAGQAPQVHLPPIATTTNAAVPVTGHQNTLKRVFADNPKLKNFTRLLGLTPPTELAAFTDYTLPQYLDPVARQAISDEQHRQHIAELLTCWRNGNSAARATLQSQLAEVPFFRVCQPRQPLLVPPQYEGTDATYRATSELVSYFRTAFPNMVFLHIDGYKNLGLSAEQLKNLEKIWEELGVDDLPQVTENADAITAADNKYRLMYRAGQPEETATNYRLHALDEVLSSPLLTVENHDFLFKLLAQLAHQQQEAFKRVYKFLHRNTWYSLPSDSYILQALKKHPWLLDTSGTLRRPQEFADSTMQLADIYPLQEPGAEVLLKLLNISTAAQKQIDNLPAYQQALLRKIQQLVMAGLTSEQIEEALEKGTTGMMPTPIINKPAPAPPVPIPAADADRSNDLKAERTAQQNPDPARPDRPAADGGDDDTPDPNAAGEATARRLEKERRKLEALEAELLENDRLAAEAASFPKYSYGWFKALLALEAHLSGKKDAAGTSFSLSFGRVEWLDNDPKAKLLVLREPAGFIPRGVEDHPNLRLVLHLRGGAAPRTVRADVVSAREATLRIKLANRDELQGLTDFGQVQRVTLTVQSPAFLLNRLMEQFRGLGLADGFDMQANLTPKLRFIFGPPGTGKTHHLAHTEIMERMKTGAPPARILVLAPTNKAADVLTERLLPAPAAGATLPVAPAWLVRYGTTAENKLGQISDLVQGKEWDPEAYDQYTLITTTARFPYAMCAGGQQALAAAGWDYVILDEASMIPLYQAVNIIYQLPACQEFIIGGDPLQIPPVTYAPQWEGETIYSLVGLCDFVNPTTAPHDYEVEKLMVQRRATPPLGRLFSQYAYGGQLGHARPLAGTALLDGHSYAGCRPETFGALALGDVTVVRFPVRPGEGLYAARSLEQGGHYHAYSALLAAELVRYLAQHILPRPGSDAARPYRVGIVVPYAPQALLVRELLKQLPLVHPILIPTEDVATVHGFQGDECDLVIALFSPPPRISASPDPQRDIFLNRQYLVNVAISRARDRLVLFMPDEETPNEPKLREMHKLLALLKKEKEGTVETMSAAALERVLFNDQPDFIIHNSFATSHQTVNVYGQGVARYELRCGDTAVDAQVNLTLPGVAS